MRWPMAISDLSGAPHFAYNIGLLKSNSRDYSMNEYYYFRMLLIHKNVTKFMWRFELFVELALFVQSETASLSHVTM